MTSNIKNEFMSTRRQFLQSLSLLTAGLAIPSVSEKAFAASLNFKKEVGIQLWTLKDLIKNDLNTTLEALSKMGYASIETYGFDGNFFEIPPAEFHSFCSGLGLEVHSTHTNITDKNAAFLAEKAAAAGLEYLIMPSMMGRPENSIDDFKRTAEEMNRMGETCRQFNLRFGYHNHEFEFRKMEGQLPYDILLAETEPSLVDFQLDIYWIVKAGCDPVLYFQNHPKRFSTWHVKDLGNDGESCIVGNGIIDFKALMQEVENAGLHRIFVEQESFSEGSPLYCVEQSLHYIQSNLL
jgi:sugar phosphate isomerase/epimerase